MIPTLQDLYLALGDCDQSVETEYNRRRKVKVAEIREDIRDLLENTDWADAIAEKLMAGAEEMGRVHGDTIDAEIGSNYTKSGHPELICV